MGQSLAKNYTYFSFTNYTREYGFTRMDRLYGYSAGLIIGRRHQVSLEITRYSNSNRFSFNSRPLFSVGYIWSLR